MDGSKVVYRELDIETLEWSETTGSYAILREGGKTVVPVTVGAETTKYTVAAENVGESDAELIHFQPEGESEPYEAFRTFPSECDA